MRDGVSYISKSTVKQGIKKREMLADYQLKFQDDYNSSVGHVKKLVPEFSNKEKYVLYYKNL